MSALDMREVSVRFGRGHVLRDVDLTMAEGEIHGLLGPNGAGKTTLLKAILGVNDHSGVIERDTASRVGRLIEYPAFYGGLTLRENLDLHARYLGTSRDEVPVLLAEVGLAHRHDLRFSRASLGTRQRLGIARALLGEPRLVLLDEPTNGLDPLGVRDVRRLLLMLRRDRRVSMLVSSHHLSEIESIADQLLFMKNGRIVYRTTRPSEQHALVRLADREREVVRDRPDLLVECVDGALLVLGPAARIEEFRRERGLTSPARLVDLEELYATIVTEAAT